MMDIFLSEYLKIHKLDSLNKNEIETILLYLDIAVKGIMEEYNVYDYNLFMLRVSELNHSLIASSNCKDVFYDVYVPLAIEKNQKLKKKISKFNYTYYVRKICKVFFVSSKMYQFMNETYFKKGRNLL